jgi:hypothetical protein
MPEKKRMMIPFIWNACRDKPDKNDSAGVEILGCDTTDRIGGPSGKP